MTLSKFQHNQTTGSKAVAKNFKKALFRNGVPETNYPVLGYPDFANFPVLVTRFLSSLVAPTISLLNFIIHTFENQLEWIDNIVLILTLFKKSKNDIALFQFTVHSYFSRIEEVSKVFKHPEMCCTTFLNRTTNFICHKMPQATIYGAEAIQTFFCIQTCTHRVFWFPIGLVSNIFANSSKAVGIMHQVDVGLSV